MAQQPLSIAKREPLAIAQREPVPTSSGSSSMPTTPLQTLEDYIIGLGKSGLGVIDETGKLIRKIPGVQAASEAVGELQLPFSPEPSNAVQAAGKLSGDVGQFFIPATWFTKGAKATELALQFPKLAEAAKAYALSMAQGSGQLGAGTTAALTAALPGGGAARRAAGALERSAEKTMVQALAPTKEIMKTTAREVAPGMLERGVRGSRSAMLAQARQQVAQVGEQIGTEVATAARAGTTIGSQTIRQAIDQALDTLVVPTENFMAGPRLAAVGETGAGLVIPGTESVVRQLQRLRLFVDDLGEQIPIDKAHKIKVAWDRIVNKAGLFGPKATASATDNAKAWAIREAASAFRKELTSATPNLKALNEEYKFWKGLQSVLVATEQRTQSHGAGLVTGVTGTVGMGAGYLSGDSLPTRLTGAVAGAVAGRSIVKLIQSPYWRTSVSGPMKRMLADALAKDNVHYLDMAVERILATLPAEVSQRLR